jgi:hypothetical protein
MRRFIVHGEVRGVHYHRELSRGPRYHIYSTTPRLSSYCHPETLVTQQLYPQRKMDNLNSICDALAEVNTRYVRTVEGDETVAKIGTMIMVTA